MSVYRTIGPLVLRVTLYFDSHERVRNPFFNILSGLLSSVVQTRQDIEKPSNPKYHILKSPLGGPYFFLL